jgi:predicted permease
MVALLSRARSLWRSLRHRAAINADMDEEFRLHLDLRMADLVRSGLTPSDAARQARIEFGGMERYKEEGREALGLRHLDELRTDLRYAARSLRKSPGFTLAAVLTLALGVGANSAVFSLLSASLLRPLPFENAERLVTLYQTLSEPNRSPRPMRWSYPEFLALRSTLTTVSHLATYYASDLNLSGGDADPVRVRAEMVSALYLTALAVSPVLGRGFLPEEDSIPGAHPVALLGHELWSRIYGADSQIVRRRILLNGVPLSVVGVLPAGFRGLTGGAEVWIPQAMAPAVYFPGQLTTPQHFLSVVGRLRPDVTIEQARAEVAVAGVRATNAARAEAGADDEGEWGTTLQSLEQARHHPTTVRAQLVLAGAVFFVLLIAVVNLSSLLLARSTIRARETALRAALGAGRFRLVRHALTEGALLGLLSAAVGVLLASWCIRTLATLAPERFGGPRPRMADLAAFAQPSVDWRVIVFATALALTAGLFAGLIPSLRATREDLTRALQTGARGASVGVGSLRRPTVLSIAAIAQVACALVLLVGAGLLLRAFEDLRAIDPGFRGTGVIAFRLSAPERSYGGNAAAPLFQRVLERVQAVPGVRSASVSQCTPFGGCSSTHLHITGRPDPAELPLVGRLYVSPDHFRTLGIPLLRGRALTAEDRNGRPRVTVINETAARRFWPGEDPIGKRVWFTSGGSFASPDSLTEIVGVVGDVLYGKPGDEIGPDFYTSYLQHTLPTNMVLVRAANDPLALVPALRQAVAEVDPDLPIHDIRTLRERGEAALASERFATLALVVFACLGVALASLGVYGIMAYSVAQRRREIGIRLALGASPREVRRLVVSQGAALTAVGLAVGVGTSLALARALTALIATIGSADPRTFLIVVPILMLVALLACYLPARTATRVHVVEAIAAD